MTRHLALAALALVVFVASAVMLHIAFRVIAAAAVRDSCGGNCYTDVYLGPDVFIVTLVLAIAIATGVVRYAAGKTRQRP